MNKTITIRLDDQLAEMLDLVADQTGRTRSGLIREALHRRLVGRPLADGKDAFTDEAVLQAEGAYPTPRADDGGFLVSEPKENPIKEKAFQFALKTVHLYQQLQDQREYVLSKQLLRSGTSIGANVEEAMAAESRRDFLHKLNIASKEARETNYWLRLLRDSDLAQGVEIAPILSESLEIVKMLTAIVKTTSKNLNR